MCEKPRWCEVSLLHPLEFVLTLPRLPPGWSYINGLGTTSRQSWGRPSEKQLTEAVEVYRSTFSCRVKTGIKRESSKVTGTEKLEVRNGPNPRTIYNGKYSIMSYDATVLQCHMLTVAQKFYVHPATLQCHKANVSLNELNLMRQ